MEQNETLLPSRSEVETYSKIIENSQEELQQIEFIDPESQLIILLNRRWKYEHYLDQQVTDVEKLVWSCVPYAAKAYAAQVFYESDAKYAKMDSLPYPLYDVDLSTVYKRMQEYIAWAERQNQ